MKARTKRMGFAGGALGCALVIGGTMAGATGWLSFGSVSKASTKAVGIAAPNILASGLSESVVAQGSLALENPDAASKVAYYGYLADGRTRVARRATSRASTSMPTARTV